jgi:predicted nucleic acid-binding protein
LGERGLRYLEGAVTLDLALYELGNVLGLTFYDASYLYLAKSRDRRPAAAWG